jgi:hypothetical protein
MGGGRHMFVGETEACSELTGWQDGHRSLLRAVSLVMANQLGGSRGMLEDESISDKGHPCVQEWRGPASGSLSQDQAVQNNICSA